MASTIVFKIGNTDLSGYVLGDGSYNVNREEVYEEWVDGAGITRREPIRATGRVVGTFDVFFPTYKNYTDFLDTIAANKLPNLTIPMTVAPNNEKNVANIYGYLKFSPVRKLKYDWSDIMERFTIEVTEA